MKLSHVSERGMQLVAFANENGVDRAVRLVLSAAILGLGWFGAVDQLVGVACRILGWYPLVTGFLGWSPLYAVLGWSTRAKR